MNIFQLIKQVLDESYGLIEEPVGSRDKIIIEELARLKGLYADLLQYRDVNYGNPATRFAYVFRYVTSHANLVATLVRRSKILTDLLTQPGIRMVALGGGPGSDMLGVLKQMQSAGFAGKFSVQIFDREAAWSDTWEGVFDRVECGVRVSPSFVTFDVSKPEVWRNINRFLTADLFTLIYFVSEVYGIRDKAKPFFDHLLSRAKKGALLLYIDNNRSEFTDWFDGLLEEHGWEFCNADEEMIRIPNDEEKTDLGPYFKKFGHPKITADVAWRIVRKR
jgi:hypothetical protein